MMERLTANHMTDPACRTGVCDAKAGPASWQGAKEKSRGKAHFRFFVSRRGNVA